MDLYTQYLNTDAETDKEAIGTMLAKEKDLRQEAKDMIKQALPEAEAKDKDYVFIHFILNNLPRGVIGLLLAMFFCAAMSSTASELNALASTSLIDFYKRVFKKEESQEHYVRTAKILTLTWGLIAIAFAALASLFENLIQFVNIIGSLFYGTILGVFVAAFYFKKIGSRAVFIAAIITEILILVIWKADVVAFLWLNLIGCVLVILIGYLIEAIAPGNPEVSPEITD